MNWKRITYPYDAEFIESNEMARIKVGSVYEINTILRCRPMWTITNPFSIGSLFTKNTNAFEISAVIPINKFENLIEKEYLESDLDVDRDFSFLGEKVVKVNFKKS